MAFRTASFYTQPPPLVPLLEFFPSRVIRMAQGSGQICLLPHEKGLIASDFSETLPSHAFSFNLFPATPPYPVDEGSAQILRRIAPNTRRVRWPSANRSQ